MYIFGCIRVPYLSALEVCSRRGATKIHVYLYHHYEFVTLCKASSLQKDQCHFKRSQIISDIL